MKTVFRSSFAGDLKKIKDHAIFEKVKQAVKTVETANNLNAVNHLVKMSGSGDFYRIRVKNYRIGIALEDDQVVFVCCLHRRDIYRFFP